MRAIPISRKSNNDSANTKLNGMQTKLIFKKDKIHEGDDLLISTTKDILLHLVWLPLHCVYCISKVTLDIVKYFNVQSNCALSSMTEFYWVT
jgi:hypothetical protein